jgi:PAS domain S-box-containing protein/putative nucleotidyltransferase with HDIG domain
MAVKPTCKELQKKLELLKDELASYRQREETYRFLVESSSDSFYVVDKDCRYLFANNNYLVRQGVSKENLIGKFYGDFHSKQQKIIFAENIMGVFDTGNSDYQEHKSEKDEKYFLRTFSPIRERGPEAKVTAVAVVSKDITARKLLHNALHESEMKFRALMESSASITIVVQGEKFRYVNPAFERLSGYTFQDLQEMKFWDIIHTDFQKLVKERGFARQKNENIPTRYEFKYVTKSGETRWIDFSSTYFEFENKPALLASGFDITEHKQIEDALRESEEKYRLLIENANEAIFVAQDGKLKFINPKTIEIIGYSQEELMSNLFTQFIHPDDQQMVMDKHVRRLRGDEMANVYPFRVIKKDGRVRWVEVNVVRVMWDDRAATLNFMSDITERSEIEQRLIDSEKNYRTIFETTGSAMMILDEDTTIALMNSHSEALSGYKKEEIEDNKISWTKLVHKDDIEQMRYYHYTRRLDPTQTPNAYEFRLVDKQGNIKNIYLNIAMFPGSKKSVVALLDITDRKRTEEALKDSLGKLQRTLYGTIQAMAMTVEMRDAYTAGHQKRVANLARTIAQEMGLSHDQIDALRMAGIIHDIGKICVPAEILSKPTKLTDIELQLIQIHSQVGHDILKEIEFLWPVAKIVLQHHERMDGSGYPNGIKGDEIMIEARILSVTDVVEAIASNRPYRPAQGLDAALKEISMNRGILYDADVVDACLRLFNEKGFRFE